MAAPPKVSFAAIDVPAKLKRLAELDPRHDRTFGANGHHYRLAPVVDVATVAAFEKEHGLVLPADYREFLTVVGNGGAGPYYGIFALGEMDDDGGHAPWEVGTVVGRPGKPFPYRKAWNLSAKELEKLQEDEDDEALLKRYWVPRDGALPICHEGCALRDWLVVSGPEAGHVWHDATADFGGWSPVTDASGGRMSFGAWYVQWLDKAFKELGG